MLGLYKTANPLSIEMNGLCWPAVPQTSSSSGDQTGCTAATSPSCFPTLPLTGAVSGLLKGLWQFSGRRALPSQSLGTARPCDAGARDPCPAGSCRCSWHQSHRAPSACRSDGHSSAAWSAVADERWTGSGQLVRVTSCGCPENVQKQNIIFICLTFMCDLWLPWFTVKIQDKQWIDTQNGFVKNIKGKSVIRWSKGSIQTQRPQ